jgi:tight adherence protein C
MTPPAHTIFGLDVITIATFMSALAVGALMIAIYAASTARDPMAKRVKALNERREQLKAGITASTRKRSRLNQSSRTTEQMKSLLGGLKVLQDKQLKETQTKLMQAGIRSKDAAIAVIFARMVLPIAIGGTCIFGVYVLGWFPAWGGFKHYMLVAGSLLLSYKAPDLFVQNRVTKRTAAIRKGLPDALDLLVICAEAGLTVDAAFARVSKELGKGYPELGDEMALTAIELGFLTDRRLAFENLAQRVDLESIRGVVTTMIQTEKYGTPLASALRVLSAEFRHARMMKAEEKAARLPAIMTVPLILFILPVLFIVILGPAACSISDNLMKN